MSRRRVVYVILEDLYIKKTINMQQVFCSANYEMHMGPQVDLMWNDPKINLRQTAPMEHTARQNTVL